jgi:predicted Zn-dependent protease
MRETSNEIVYSAKKQGGAMIEFKRPSGEKLGQSFADTLAIFKKEAESWITLLSSKLEDIPGNHKAIGKSFLERGIYTDAIHRFKLVRWMRPKDAEVVALLALALARSGNAAKAKEAFKDLKLKHPSYPQMAETEQLLREALTPPTQQTKTPTTAESIDSGGAI